MIRKKLLVGACLAWMGMAGALHAQTAPQVAVRAGSEFDRQTREIGREQGGVRE